MQSEQEDAGVWPAYVAAVAGLVQSLLFVSAIMAMTLLQVGMLAGKKVDETLSRAITEQPGHAGQVSAGANASGGTGQGSGGGGFRKDAVSAQRSPEAREGQLDLRFAPDTLQLDEAAKERLRELLRRQIAMGMRQWLAYIETDVDDSLQRRAGYLRLMAARNVFVEMEIEPHRLTLRLMPTKAASAQPGTLLRIVPSRQEPAAPAAATPAAPVAPGAPAATTPAEER